MTAPASEIPIVRKLRIGSDRICDALAEKSVPVADLNTANCMDEAAALIEELVETLVDAEEFIESVDEGSFTLAYIRKLLAKVRQ